MTVQAEHHAIHRVPHLRGVSGIQRYVTRQIIVARREVLQSIGVADRLPRRALGERVTAIGAACAADGVRIVMLVLSGEQGDPVFPVFIREQDGPVFRRGVFLQRLLRNGDELALLLRRSRHAVALGQRRRGQQRQAQGQHSDPADQTLLHRYPPQSYSPPRGCARGQRSGPQGLPCGSKGGAPLG